MDLDDLMPAKKSSGVMIGENLSTLSVAELAQRIKDLGAEIERVQLELEKNASTRRLRGRCSNREANPKQPDQKPLMPLSSGSAPSLGSAEK